jgi:DNA polymerase III subunit beta
MEISITRPQLIRALELLTRVSTKHVTLPVLQCALLEATEGKLCLRATNLELSIEIEIPCKVTEPGIVAVPATTLLQSIQYDTDTEILLRVEEGVLLIESKKTNTSIKAIPHEEFPVINRLHGNTITLHRALFSLGIKTTAFAASVSSIKPELGSVFIQQKKEQSLTLVATDSFRLMEKTVPQKGVILEQNLLIPQKNAIELSRLCDLLEKDPELMVSENQCALWFREEGVYVASRLVSGSFPDYEQIIPKEYVTKVTVLKNDILKALKKTSVFLNRYQQVTVSVTEGGLTFSSQNNEVGHVTDSVPASVEGDDLTLNFNQQYIADSLGHVTDDSVILHFAGIGRPLVITGVGDKSLRYLVMPMNR